MIFPGMTLSQRHRRKCMARNTIVENRLWERGDSLS